MERKIPTIIARKNGINTIHRLLTIRSRMYFGSMGMGCEGMVRNLRFVIGLVGLISFIGFQFVGPVKFVALVPAGNFTG